MSSELAGKRLFLGHVNYLIKVQCKTNKTAERILRNSFFECLVLLLLSHYWCISGTHLNCQEQYKYSLLEKSGTYPLYTEKVLMMQYIPWSDTFSIFFWNRIDYQFFKVLCKRFLSLPENTWDVVKVFLKYRFSHQCYVWSGFFNSSLFYYLTKFITLFNYRDPQA